MSYKSLFMDVLQAVPSVTLTFTALPQDSWLLPGHLRGLRWFVFLPPYRALSAREWDLNSSLDWFGPGGIMACQTLAWTIGRITCDSLNSFVVKITTHHSMTFKLRKFNSIIKLIHFLLVIPFSCGLDK
eukprot:TRINITY_DN606_c0_g1_i6.p1 TRINITY_DN606_c0_g1~~TRINITY_DN606_c0_g1_i6.p1  ORF type:complete len:129 (-),score=7.53 TRINITY_DN606_c0_g1_i6:225-611(-)